MAFRGVLGGHKSKSLGRLSNDWTDWHQIWYTSADGNGQAKYNSLGGHTFKSQRTCKGLVRLASNLVQCADSMKVTPNKVVTRSLHLGGFRGSKLSNTWTDWHQLWFTSADSSGNGHLGCINVVFWRVFARDSAPGG